MVQTEVKPALAFVMEAAKRIGVTRNTVKTWSRLGILPPLRRVGGRLAFKREQLEAALVELMER